MSYEMVRGSRKYEIKSDLAATPVIAVSGIKQGASVRIPPGVSTMSIYDSPNPNGEPFALSSDGVGDYYQRAVEAGKSYSLIGIVADVSFLKIVFDTPSTALLTLK